MFGFEALLAWLLGNGRAWRHLRMRRMPALFKRRG
jgi:hypothetical protein